VVFALRWDPSQYAVYSDERSRPFFELLARVDITAPADVVDLGCGPGPLTAALLQRWPQSRVVGVDSSAEMVATARDHEVAGRLSFVHADVANWAPDGRVDLVVANALLQWIPDHVALLPRFASWLRPGGVVAFQVPDNFDEPSHTLLRDLRMSPRWAARLGAGADRAIGVERPETYLRALLDIGLSADVWQTSYLHILPGDDAVLEWVKGTALRPVLSALDSDQQRAEFLVDYSALLRAAYPPQPWGTVFPFRRTFAVGLNRQGR
jgi:trans-aconitate 2-methyltransferase